MKKIFLFPVLMILAACSQKKDISEVLQSKFDVHVISNNYSGPAINLEENHLKDILLLLHYNFPAEEIKEQFQINDRIYAFYINNLFGEGLIKKNDEGNFVPTCMVIDSENGESLKKTADSLGREMSLIAIDRLAKIKEAYKGVAAFKSIPFEEASLFILGNVIHNHWQMPEIEAKYIKAEAPRRGLNRYYLSIVENSAERKNNPLEIFTNRFQSYEKYIAGSFGNKFSGKDSVVTLVEPDGILKKQIPGTVFIGKEDDIKLRALAQIISTDLLNYLEKNRTLFVKLYLNSIYKDQTSFREWFVWFYQLIITRTCKTLTEKEYIKISTASINKFVLINHQPIK